MDKLIDFDALYAAHVKLWIKENARKFKGAEDIEAAVEDQVAGIYARWLDKPQPEIGGISPRAYFDALSGDALVALFLRYCGDKRIDVPSPLSERIVQDSAALTSLASRLSGMTEEKMLSGTLQILQEADITPYIDTLAQLLTGERCEGDGAQYIVDILTQYPEECRDALLPHIGKSTALDRHIADILVHCPGRAEVFGLLCRLFEQDIDCMLYAAYLGMYGNPDALPLLNKRIRSGEADYPEFLELRSAVEALGGEVEYAPDFSDDPYFKKLKDITVRSEK